jgi:hypothetical protein
MFYFEITDADWEAFEDKFKIMRGDVVEVPNRYRSPGRSFIHKDNLEIYNESITNYNMEEYRFTIYEENLMWFQLLRFKNIHTI